MAIPAIDERAREGPIDEARKLTGETDDAEQKGGIR